MGKCNATAQTNGVVARKKRLELRCQCRVEGDGAGPAYARAQRVAITEAAAGDDALEVGQLGAAAL